MKSFFVTTSDQDEDGFLVEAKDINHAREEALRELGWYVVEDDTEEDTQKNDKKSAKNTCKKDTNCGNHNQKNISSSRGNRDSKEQEAWNPYCE